MEQKKAVAATGTSATAHLMPPVLSFTAPTPHGSPAAPPRVRSASENETEDVSEVLPAPPLTRANSDGPKPKPGKRKAEDRDVDGGGAPRAIDTVDPRARNASHSHSSTPSSSHAHAPSSFHRQKRAKLGVGMAPDQQHGQSHSASGESGSSAGSPHTPARQLSRAASRASSLPISALVAPHAPSVARSAGGTAYHMRDPRKAPRVQPTGWGLTLGDGGSGAHAWLFFAGFLFFPLWWIAGLCVPVPRTRRLRSGSGAEEAQEQEKGTVVLDDPQVEFDARSWRKRCRIMAGVSLATYVPFIVLVAVFVPRA
ncbi:hypothetical protein FB451DRAFT_428735 [Mycena latifolia]|nr:hypothetical protein FB451DRAFT_428735 [Mycena latifolia]